VPKSVPLGPRDAISLALTPNKDSKRSGSASAEIVANPDDVIFNPIDARILATSSMPAEVRHSLRSRI
jgi:hypothetical protein